MSRKSSSKKEKVLWYNCEKCAVKVTSQDRNNHEKCCPIDPDKDLNFSFIRGESLFTATLDIISRAKDEIASDIPAKYLNNLIFISESAVRLCNFAIGDKVVISCNQKPEVVPLVRTVWPTRNQYLTTVFVSNDDFQLNWTPFKSAQIRIEKLSSEALPATEVILDFVKSENFIETQELTKILQIRLRALIFCIGNEITFDFYNKQIKFTVVDFSSHVERHESTLEEDLKNLNLKEISKRKFFIITNETRIKLHYELENVKENADIKIFDKITKESIGGLEDAISTIEESMNIALGYQKIPKGLKISKGILLFGPTGCGKSMICEALANTTKANVILINTNEIFSKFFGETEKNLKKYFGDAFANYPDPTLIIVEEVNNICPKNETNEVIKRASISFLGLLDSLHHRLEGSRVFILATTGNIENLNSALRRCGRIDSEIEIGAPNPLQRRDILEKHLQNVTYNFTKDDLKEIADVTHGYVGSDLANIVYKAAVHCVKENRNAVNLDDMNYALNQVKPSAMREVLIENPNVRWEDIGGQQDLKLKLKQAIEWPLLYPEKFTKLGIKPPRGILMFGPPGCSKTMIAKALATESRVNFLSIKGPELFSMWVGESERAVREVFRKARQVSPSIIFFDEIDAIGGERSSESGSSVKERVLAQMLTELDGVNTLQNVTIIAATNRPDMIDKALLRPGRIDRIVYVGLPDRGTREEIFKIKLKVVPAGEDVSIEELVTKTDGYSGAEIQAVCNEAAFKALEESLDSRQLYWRHFENALEIVQPRTSKDLLKLYEEYMKKDVM